MQKKRLYAHCQSLVRKKIEDIEAAMREAQGAANEETKSSAGDKYETGRAMMQLEKEKLASQRAEVLKLKKVLDQIDPNRQPTKITLGSLVQTSRGQFFVAAGLGNIMLDEEACFVISPTAPIGQAMMGLEAGEQFVFRGEVVKISEVV